MWSKENEAAFQTLIKKYKENPRQKIIHEENKLIEHLRECYLNAKSGSEMEFFKKLCGLYNLFLEDYFKTYPQILEDGEKLKETLKKYPLKKEYPLFEKLEHTISCDVEIEKNRANSTYENFINKPPFNILLDSDQRANLDPHYTKFPYARNPKPTDLFMLPYHEMVEEIYKDVQKKSGSDIKLEKERDKLIHSYYRSKRATSLNALKDLYRTLNPSKLVNSYHVFYQENYSERICSEYSGSFTQDVLPHPIFGTTLAKLAFQNIERRIKTQGGKIFSEAGPLNLILQLLGKAFFENSKDFPGYRMLPKTVGVDPGFILVSQDGQKYYVKYVEKSISIYFCSKVLSHLGIKMPEAQLLIDEFGNPLYMTLDASREYTKSKRVKRKEFKTLMEEITTVSQFDFAPPEKEGAFPKLAGEFLKAVGSSKELRKSFAKLLLVRATLGLSDLENKGNIGFIRTTKNPENDMGGENQYTKFGIVDFQFSPISIAIEDIGKDPLRYIKNTLISSSSWSEGEIEISPMFSRIFEILAPEDFRDAAQELATPKQRIYTEKGLLLTSKVLGLTTNQTIIESTFKEVAEELRKKLPEKEAKEQIAELQAQKNIIIENLSALIGAVQKIEVERGDRDKPSI